MKYSAYALAGLMATVAFAPGAIAQTVDQEISVSLTVENSCSVSAPNIELGTYNRDSGSEISSKITVSCSEGASYSVSISEPSGGHVLKSGENTIAYTLEDGNGGAFPTTAGAGVLATAEPAEITVRAKVAANSNAPAGAYTDTVTVLVTY